MDQAGWVTVAIALVAAIPPTLMAMAAWMTSKSNAKKADTIIEKAAEIHTLTNSTLSATTSALAIANEKIAGLEKLIGALAMGKT